MTPSEFTADNTHRRGSRNQLKGRPEQPAENLAAGRRAGVFSFRHDYDLRCATRNYLSTVPRYQHRATTDLARNFGDARDSSHRPDVQAAKGGSGKEEIKQIRQSLDN